MKPEAGRRSGFFVSAYRPEPVPSGLFHVHTMRDRFVVLVRVLEILHLAAWLAKDLPELVHSIAAAFI